MREFICVFFALMFICSAPAYASDIDLSSPQKTYETCYGVVDFAMDNKNVAEKIRTCLTPTAQKTVISYAVLGGLYISSLKDLRGNPKHPKFASEISAVIFSNKLKTASRKDLQKADLATILSEIIAVYAAYPEVVEQLTYSARALKDVEINDQTATGIEEFALKYPFPKNKLTLDFIKVDNRWLINYISYM